jgi:hypothetical protein
MIEHHAPYQENHYTDSCQEKGADAERDTLRACPEGLHVVAPEQKHYHQDADKEEIPGSKKLDLA